MSRVQRPKARPYKDYMPRTGPPSMQGQNGTILWGDGVGANMDEQQERLKNSVRARMPELAPTDGLAKIGRDSQIERGPTETDAAYGTRLRNRWDFWDQAGAFGGLLADLKAQEFPSGITGAHIVQQNGLSAYIDGSENVIVADLMDCVNRRALDGTIPGNLKGWVFEIEGPNANRDQFFSQFGILFVTDVPTLREGTVDQSRINAIAEKLRPGKAVFRGTWVIETGNVHGWPITQTHGGGGGPTYGGAISHFISAPLSVTPMT